MEPLRINANLVIPPDELRARAVRSSGPGGQNVNKVATKIELRFSVAKSRALGERRKSILFRRLARRLTAEGELLVRASRHRERARNLADARERLAETLREALRPEKKRVPTKPTRASKRRRLDETRRRSEVKRRRGSTE